MPVECTGKCCRKINPKVKKTTTKCKNFIKFRETRTVAKDCDLKVLGDVTIKKNLTVGQDVTIKGDLEVQGCISFDCSEREIVEITTDLDNIEPILKSAAELVAIRLNTTPADALNFLVSTYGFDSTIMNTPYIVTGVNNNLLGKGATMAIFNGAIHPVLGRELEKGGKPQVDAFTDGAIPFSWLGYGDDDDGSDWPFLPIEFDDRSARFMVFEKNGEVVTLTYTGGNLERDENDEPLDENTTDPLSAKVTESLGLRWIQDRDARMIQRGGTLQIYLNNTDAENFINDSGGVFENVTVSSSYLAKNFPEVLTDGPWNIVSGETVGAIDGSDTLVFRCGELKTFVPQVPPLNFKISTVEELKRPQRRTISRVNISLADGATGASFDFIYGVSCESIADGAVITKNGSFVHNISGAGTTGTSPYLDSDFLTTPFGGPLTLTPDDVISVNYIKDGLAYSGLDSMYFYIKDLDVDGNMTAFPFNGFDIAGLVPNQPIVNNGLVLTYDREFDEPDFLNIDSYTNRIFGLNSGIGTLVNDGIWDFDLGAPGDVLGIPTPLMNYRKRGNNKAGGEVAPDPWLRGLNIIEFHSMTYNYFKKYDDEGEEYVLDKDKEIRELDRDLIILDKSRTRDTNSSDQPVILSTSDINEFRNALSNKEKYLQKQLMLKKLNNRIP